MTTTEARIVGRFAPKANPQFKFAKSDVEIRWLVATDVLAEGLNMQDCDVVLNYDLHWNPVRLIQRFGRIDRIGSEHEMIWGLNFLPEKGIEQSLHIEDILKRRIQEIHDSIGEDAKILDESEHLNTEAMYAIYEAGGRQLMLFDEDDDDEVLDLNEAEELLRTLMKKDPTEFSRIAELRDGIRSSLNSTNKGQYVFCRQRTFSQLILADPQGNIKSREISEVLRTIRADEAEPIPESMPSGYNTKLMEIKRSFAEDAKQRRATMKYSMSLTQGQRYVIRELRVLFERTDDDDLKARINLLDQAFRVSPTQAVKKELNLLRRNGAVGDALLRQLSDIYFHHKLEDRVNSLTEDNRDDDVARIVCSEALI